MDWPDVGEHTATRLSDGRVLVVGEVMMCGSAGCVAHGGALFDPQTDTWSAIADAPAPLEGRTATLLDDGRVVLVGGADVLHHTTAAVLTFDPASNAFVPAPPLAASLAYHTASRLNDGRVIITGGHRREGTDDLVLAAVQIYDAVTETWIEGTSLVSPRERHTASVTGNAVLIAGGVGLLDGVPRPTATTEIYDAALDEWQVVGYLAGPAVGHTMTALTTGAGVLVVSNGVGAMTKTPFSQWEPTGEMQRPRSNHVATPLRDGRVMVAGGSPYQPLLIAEIYDPATSTWSTTCEQPAEITAGSATLLDDGRVLVISGRPLLFHAPSN
ncbi:MAG: Kelch repeat-containing protein [Kofleriaceae bacterium]